jgi:hypothetical protein
LWVVKLVYSLVGLWVDKSEKLEVVSLVEWKVCCLVAQLVIITVVVMVEKSVISMAVSMADVTVSY